MQPSETGKIYPPYYIVADVERYKTLSPESEKAKKLARKISVNIGDYAALRLVLGIDPPEFARFYPDMELTTPSTLDTIDSFLDKFGRDSQISLPTGIYMQENSNLEEVAGAQNENSITELLKQRRYQEVLELIEAQNLNNPQKSIYFAHQIRFIKKLIRIENYRNQPRADESAGTI